MKVCGKIFFAVALGLLFAASAANAQEKKLVPKFDAANQTTIKGVIDQVSDYECPISGSMGSHLSVRNSDGTVEVHLAASKFLKEYGIVFAKGDAVQVTGTKTTFDGKPALLARQVTVGDRTYSFRDDKGIPLW
jgi:DNA/RNA endonuclease YhcR with UshA esterase domain